MKTHWSLRPVHLALCHPAWLRALVLCLIGKHWFSEICIHERMRVKRQTTVHHYYENSFDHAYPLKWSQEPTEVSGPLLEKHWSSPRSKKFTPTEHKYSFIHSTSISWAPTMCQQLCQVLRIPQQTKHSPAFAQPPFSWGRRSVQKHTHSDVR